MRALTAIRIALVAAALSPAASQATEIARTQTDGTPTVRQRVLERGYVRCGMDMTPGFSGIDGSGRPTGFDVDFCRAIAAAVLGDGEAIRTLRVNTKHKFEAVVSGDLDVAFGMTTWTFTRDSTLGVSFPAITYYDGQGFMAWSESGIATPDGITTGTVCVQEATTSEGNLKDFLRDRSSVEVMPTPSSEDKFNAFIERRCSVVTGDRSELAVQRTRRAIDPQSWSLLQGTISREPLGPIVTAGDPEWFTIVRWAMLVPIIAEARGVTGASLASTTESDREMQRLRGEDPEFGKELGLNPDWARKILESVGSYAEIFSRNLSPMGLDRGENDLWRNGGLIYAPPLR